MTHELQSTWKHAIVTYYSGAFLDGLRKTMTNLSQGSLSPGRNLNPGPPKYEVLKF